MGVWCVCVCVVCVDACVVRACVWVCVVCGRVCGVRVCDCVRTHVRSIEMGWAWRVARCAIASCM